MDFEKSPRERGISLRLKVIWFCQSDQPIKKCVLFTLEWLGLGVGGRGSPLRSRITPCGLPFHCRHTCDTSARHTYDIYTFTIQLHISIIATHLFHCYTFISLLYIYFIVIHLFHCYTFISLLYIYFIVIHLFHCYTFISLLYIYFIVVHLFHWNTFISLVCISFIVIHFFHCYTTYIYFSTLVSRTKYITTM